MIFLKKCYISFSHRGLDFIPFHAGVGQHELSRHPAILSSADVKKLKRPERWWLAGLGGLFSGWVSHGFPCWCFGSHIHISYFYISYPYFIFIHISYLSIFLYFYISYSMSIGISTSTSYPWQSPWQFFEFSTSPRHGVNYGNRFVPEDWIKASPKIQLGPVLFIKLLDLFIKLLDQ